MAKLYFNYAAMNAGKSTILLQSSHNYIERGMNTLLLKPAFDTRDSHAAEIKSRIGLAAPARNFSADTDVTSLVMESHALKPLDCVLIDEAQFLTEAQVRELARIADEDNIPIMCYGLRTDFQGQLFPGSAILLAIADDLNELKTLCWCGRKATMNLRVNADGAPVLNGAQIEIGGNDRYVSLCRKHWRDKEVVCPSLDQTAFPF